MAPDGATLGVEVAAVVGGCAVGGESVGAIAGSAASPFTGTSDEELIAPVGNRESDVMVSSKDYLCEELTCSIGVRVAINA